MSTRPKQAPAKKATRAAAARSKSAKPQPAKHKSPTKSSSKEPELSWIPQLHEPVLLLSSDGFRILECNQPCTELFGMERKELLAKRFLDLCPKGLRLVAKSKLERSSGRKEEYTLQRADGSPVYVEFESVPVKSGGKPGHLCVLHDIGSRAQLVRALLEIDAANREIIENASEIIYTHDLEGHFTSANRAASTLLGYTREEIMRLTVKELVLEEDLAAAMAAVNAKQQEKHTGPAYSLRVRSKSGEVLTLEVSSRLIYRDGSAIGVQGIARDITDRLQAEAALRESEAKFRAVAESAPCAMVIYQGTRFKFINAMAERITGYSKEELLAMPEFWQIVTPEFREIVRKRAESRLAGAPFLGRFEFTIRTRAGEIRWMDFTASLIEFGGAPAAVVMMFDITERKQAEDALLKSEQLFRTVTENSSDVITILDEEGVIRYGSLSLLPVMGYTAEEVSGRSGFDYVHPSDVEAVREAFGGAVTRASGGSQRMELRLRHRTGDWKTFEAASSVLRDGARITGLLINLRDITERKLAESDLLASEEKFRQLFEQNLAGVYMSTIHGEVLDCNDSFAEIFGYRSREEVLKLRGASFYMSSEDRLQFVERLRKAGSFTNYETQCRRADGMPIWVLENVSLLPPVDGRPERIQGTMIDITERKYAEQALMESESKFRAVADTASTAIYIHNGSYFLYVNRACQEITGYTPDELLAMNPFAMVHPDDRDLVLLRGSSRKQGQPVPDRYEYRILTREGETRWVDFSASVIQFEGETAILGTAFDITERKRAEQLQAAMYRIADCANDAEDLQEFFAAIHTIVAELMPAKNFFIALHDPGTDRISFPYFVDEIDAAPDESYFTGRGVTRYVLKTGQPLLVTDAVFKELARQGEVESVGAASIDWVGAPLKSGGGQAFGVIAVQSYSEVTRYTEAERDILHFVAQHLASAIQRKRNEEALRESEQRYRSLVQSAVYGIFRASTDDHFLEANPAMVSMLGYESLGEVLRLRMSSDLYADHDEYRNLLRELRRSGRADGVEVRWRNKEGRPITVRLSGRAVLDSEGRAQSYEMIAEDVTEKRTLEDQLRQSQKMEAVGRLAGGVAHDFNNLLTVIKGYSELILDELKPSDPLRSEMEEIQQAAERAASLTRQLLAFSRQQVMAPKVLALNEVVENMDKLLRRLLGEDVELSIKLHADLGRVKADPGQLEQVIMNLAVNSRDAMPTGGKLTIETSNVRLDENYVREHVGAKEGNYVMLAVSDNGAGMTEETKQRIFEPFFTTKEMGKGTGLGLSTVYGIVKQSGGYIWVYSELGVGSAFKVYLPRVDAPAEASGTWTNLHIRMRGSETVLLVEDEDGVRALVRQVLHKHGYSVLEARNAAEAVIHCENQEADIRLLLTDVVLEQMSGRELAQRLVARRPSMKVLYMSGYTDDAIVQLGVLGPGSAFLQKPFTTEALTSKIRQVLDESLV